MPSRFWFMTPQEGFEAAYDYDSQRAFLDEAQTVVDRLITAYQGNDMVFHRDDVSAKKAVWMLHMDALDALRECLSLLKENRHTVASRLFRDIVETLDLASYFHWRTPRSASDLKKWYQDEIVSHGRVRQQIGEDSGIQAKNEKASEYKWLSKFTHRTYRVLSNAYCLGGGEKMWYDWRIRKYRVASIPQTVSQYLATVGSLVLLFIYHATSRGVFPEQRVIEILQDIDVVKPILDHLGGREAGDQG